MSAREVARQLADDIFALIDEHAREVAGDNKWEGLPPWVVERVLELYGRCRLAEALVEVEDAEGPA